ncbi:MAG TPA: AEC family transporter [Casimicrobiaceae bacterium]|nr:AEC family transporter [Casimicrobiaceae bacterium]
MSVALLVLPDFLLIALGLALKRWRGFAPEFWPGLERLVYYVLFPALLFRALAGAPLDLASAWPVVAVSVGFTLAGIVLGLAGAPLLRLPQATFAACYQCAFRFNSYLALAVASRVAGDRGLALISLTLGVLVPLVNVAAVAMLAGGRPAHVARELARNPLVIACAAGLAWNLLPLPRPAAAMRVIDLTAAAALPLGLIAVGAGLVFRREALPVRAIAFWNGLKLVVLPAIALALSAWLGLDDVEKRTALVMAAVPTATSAYVLAVQMRAPGAPVAVLITSGTLASVVTLTLWLAFAGASY